MQRGHLVMLNSPQNLRRLGLVFSATKPPGSGGFVQVIAAAPRQVFGVPRTGSVVPTLRTLSAC